MLVYDDAKLFGTTRINNHSVIATSSHILLGDDDLQYFEQPSPPQIKVSLY